MNIAELKKAAQATPSLRAEVHAQITDRAQGTTTAGKPYIEVTLADASGSEKVRLWDDSSAFKLLTDFPNMGKGTAVEVSAGWKVHSQYGLQADAPRFRALVAEEMNALFAGGAAFSAANDVDWQYIKEVFERMAKPDYHMNPLGVVCVKLLEWSEEPFRRAAAAHGVHHARRGGLLAHTASMLRVASAICAGSSDFYPEVTPEIVYAGILFHDMGKVFETDYQERGFAMEATLKGVLMGHIAISYSLLLQLWKECHDSDEELLLLHVGHLILSHHGQLEWGSPVTPCLPEAIILHQIDMMDAGIEKLRNAYSAGKSRVLGSVEAVYPMKGDIGLPYNTSAAFMRHRVSVVIWCWARSQEKPRLRMEYEKRFVEALRAEAIIPEIVPYRSLPRVAFDEAIKRWGTLRMHCEGLPALA